MSEAALQRAVLECARLLGWRVFHVHDSRRQVRPGVFVGDKDAKGFPDLTLVRRGRLIFAELKSEKGRLSSEQDAWIGELGRCPYVTVAVWTPREWRDGAIVAALREELDELLLVG